MEVLTRVRAAGRQVDFGLATTSAERAAILAQRFRVYQRRGNYRPGVTVDRDEYDDHAIYFLAMLRGDQAPGAMIGSARFVLGDGDPSFTFPAEHIFQLDFPEPLRSIPAALCGEVSRMVAERAEGTGLGGFRPRSGSSRLSPSTPSGRAYARASRSSSGDSSGRSRAPA